MESDGRGTVSDWPSVGVVRSAMRGIRAVFKTENGQLMAGFQSSIPWVYVYILGEIAGVACERCETMETLPAPPESHKGTNQAPEFLFQPGTTDYALYLLTHLHKFHASHTDCKPKVEEKEEEKVS